MKIAKVRDVKTPTRGTKKSAGIDFFVPNDFNEVILMPNEAVLIPSGIKVSVPENYALIAFNKSGVATKKQLIRGAEVVDEDYQGEIHINVINTGTLPQIISPGEKIIQFILIPMFYDDVFEVELEHLYIEPTERGEGGFGSTGTH